MTVISFLFHKKKLKQKSNMNANQKKHLFFKKKKNPKITSQLWSVAIENFPLNNKQQKKKIVDTTKKILLVLIRAIAK